VFVASLVLVVVVAVAVVAVSHVESLDTGQLSVLRAVADTETPQSQLNGIVMTSPAGRTDNQLERYVGCLLITQLRELYYRLLKMSWLLVHNLNQSVSKNSYTAPSL